MSAPQSVKSMRWYKKAEFDVPALNSPQPCAHGAGCDYKVRNKTTGEMKRGCCAFVHPGEEGTGRRLFAERVTQNEDGSDRVMPACVRLTGRAGFYERRRLRLSWPAWCERENIPYRANEPPPSQVGVVPPAMQRVIDAAVAKALKTPTRRPKLVPTQAPRKPPRVQRVSTGPLFVDHTDGAHSPRLSSCEGCACEEGICLAEGVTHMEAVD